MNPLPRWLWTAAACLALVACSKTPVAPVAQVSDTDITEHVTTALQQSALLHGSTITVVTQNGDVRLSGVLDRQAQVDEALRIARAAEGVHTLHDELTVKAATAP